MQVSAGGLQGGRLLALPFGSTLHGGVSQLFSKATVAPSKQTRTETHQDLWGIGNEKVPPRGGEQHPQESHTLVTGHPLLGFQMNHLLVVYKPSNKLP